MKLKLWTLLRRHQAGDTIVEVMVAITIMGLALGGAYALSNRSFHTSQHTHERIAALSLAQGQIEFLKDRGLKGTVGSLPNGQFCFDDDNGQTPLASSSTCRTYDNKVYDVAISKSGNTFTVQVTWAGVGTGRQNNVILYYKPQG
ncbi:MAG: prepilin-type N-terminal cleavage/methylation domain-containing protein [Candidatus Saccharimonadales bacterium]